MYLVPPVTETMLRFSEAQHHGECVLKRLVTALMLAIALLISGTVVTQPTLVGTLYADAGGE